MLNKLSQKLGSTKSTDTLVDKFENSSTKPKDDLKAKKGASKDKQEQEDQPADPEAIRVNDQMAADLKKLGYL